MNTGDPNLDRAVLLLQQDRADLAESKLRASLAGDPNNAWAHALLSRCLLGRRALRDATEEARLAVGLAPDDAFMHETLARVLLDRNMYKEATEAVEMAISLDPVSDSAWTTLAAIHLENKRWQKGLEAAERALAIDGEDEAALNLRAMALNGLGRKSEASDTVEGALSRRPDSAITHATTGWACLHRGQAKQAQVHFREALRLDPTLEHAKAGIVEALKARVFIYRWLLGFNLWMSRQSGKAQWAVILGLWVIYRFARVTAEKNPELKWVIGPVIALYIGFVLLTWFGHPIFNLLLFLHPLGRRALSRSQRWSARAFAATVTLALSLLGTGIATGSPGFVAAAVHTAAFCLPVAMLSGFARADQQKIFLCIVAGLGILWVYIAGSALVDGEPASAATGVYVLGCIFSPLLANIVGSVREPVRS